MKTLQLQVSVYFCFLIMATLDGFMIFPSSKGIGGISYRIKEICLGNAVAMDQSDFARAELARKKEEYDAAMKARLKNQVGDDTARPPSLAELPLISYLDDDGKISHSGGNEQVKASVYGIYDDHDLVQYIGVSRNVGQSLRLHLARMPDKTFAFKVFHITKPSRVLLELTREAWIEELGYQPQGNDGGEMQALWENALDVKPLMTAEDHEAIENARIKQRSEENTMKKVTRRFEDAKIQILSARGVTESLRFDPKLKGQGLLDLYLEKKTNDAVPETSLKTKTN